MPLTAFTNDRGETFAWNPQTGATLGPAGTVAWQNSALSPSGDVFVGADSESLSLYRATDGSKIRDLISGDSPDLDADNETHVIGQKNVTFSGDGSLVATWLVGEAVQVWNSHTGCLVADLTGHAGPAPAMYWAPHAASPMLITGGEDGTVRLWQILEHRRGC